MNTRDNEKLPFHKLEALGNDFMLIDARSRLLSLRDELVRQWADRRRGVGFDQLLVLHSVEQPDHHCRVEIRNADGSAAEQCGNGMRALGLWLQRVDDVAGRMQVSTPAGPVAIEYRSDDDIAATLTVPDFSPGAVGLSGGAGFPRIFSVGEEALEVYGASMGNPHLLVIEPERPAAERVERIGRTLARDPALSNGANVGLAVVESRQRVHLQVCERGAGLTQACGSGAGAAAAILLRLGRIDSPVEILQPGGPLVINWPGEGQAVNTAGPAREVFEGVIPCPTRPN